MTLPLRRGWRFRADRADLGSTPWLIAVKKDLPANDLRRTDRLAEGQSGQGVVRHRGRRQPVAHRRHAVPERHRHALPARALSRHRAGDRRTWSSGQIDMSILDPITCAAAVPRRHASRSSPSWRKAAPRTRPDIPTVDEAGCARRAHGAMAGDLGAEGHAEGRDRQAQRRGGRRRWPIRRIAPEARRAELRGRRRARSRRRSISARSTRREIEKWWPIIKAAGIKGG